MLSAYCSVVNISMTCVLCADYGVVNVSITPVLCADCGVVNVSMTSVLFSDEGVVNVSMTCIVSKMKWGQVFYDVRVVCRLWCYQRLYDVRCLQIVVWFQFIWPSYFREDF